MGLSTFGVWEENKSVWGGTERERKYGELSLQCLGVWCEEEGFLTKEYSKYKCVFALGPFLQPPFAPLHPTLHFPDAAKDFLSRLPYTTACIYIIYI
jgi:hypothetical protein